MTYFLEELVLDVRIINRDVRKDNCIGLHELFEMREEHDLGWKRESYSYSHE
jgi:hypothetical protein